MVGVGVGVDTRLQLKCSGQLFISADPNCVTKAADGNYT